MDMNQKIIVSQLVFAQMVDNEMVLLDMNSEHYFGLDEIGTAIWQAMQESENMNQVFARLLEQYDVESDILKKDLMDFVQKLQEDGLIMVSAIE